MTGYPPIFAFFFLEIPFNVFNDYVKFHFWILLFIGAKAYNHNQGCIFFILPPPPGGGQKYELSIRNLSNTPVFKPWVRGKNMILKKMGGAKI